MSTLDAEMQESHEVGTNLCSAGCEASFEVLSTGQAEAAQQQHEG
jgi:hypothetical protein